MKPRVVLGLGIILVLLGIVVALYLSDGQRRLLKSGNLAPKLPSDSLTIELRSAARDTKDSPLAATMPSQYAVKGAGNAIWNGVYTRISGSINGLPIYRKGTAYNLYYNSSLRCYVFEGSLSNGLTVAYLDLNRDKDPIGRYAPGPTGVPPNIVVSIPSKRLPKSLRYQIDKRR